MFLTLQLTILLTAYADVRKEDDEKSEDNESGIQEHEKLFGNEESEYFYGSGDEIIDDQASCL